MKLPAIAPIGTEYEPMAFKSISMIEGALGRCLPTDYSEFLMLYGRCGFAGEATIVTESSRFPIFTFFGGGNGNGSLIQQMELHPDLQAIGALPIADDLFDNIYVFDLEEGRISRLDYSSGRAVATKIADSFSEFVSRIEVTPDAI